MSLKWFRPFRFWLHFCTHFLPLPNVIHVPPTCPPWLDPHKYWSCSLCSLLHFPVTSSLPLTSNSNNGYSCTCSSVLTTVMAASSGTRCNLQSAESRPIVSGTGETLFPCQKFAGSHGEKTRSHDTAVLNGTSEGILQSSKVVQENIQQLAVCTCDSDRTNRQVRRFVTWRI
jgi:hypothetical protein